MNHITGPPAPNRLDWLSDQLGLLIPNGRILPSRHPLKVSLLLGILGLASGWTFVGMGFLWRQFDYSPWRWVFLLAAFSSSGGLLLLPLSIWSGRRVIIAVCAIPFAVLTQFAAYEIVTLNELSVVWITYVWLVIIAIAHTLWAMGIAPKRGFAVLSASVIVSVGIAFATLWMHRNFAVISRSPFHDFFFWAAVYTTFWFLLAVSLGLSLWDTAPLPKFEPDDGHDA